MKVDVVRFPNGIAPQRYACRIQTNNETFYVYAVGGMFDYLSPDKFGVVPKKALTNAKNAFFYHQILNEMASSNAEVVTEEMVKTESLLDIHKDGENLSIHTDPYASTEGVFTRDMLEHAQSIHTNLVSPSSIQPSQLTDRFKP
ncbi:hypothetical protein VPHD518_0111 [Vibrio phage D518]